MNTPAQIALGVLPAALLSLAGMVLASHIGTLFQATLLLTGVIGTCGLILSLMDYPRRAAVFVITLLVVGILGWLTGAFVNRVFELADDVRAHRLGPPFVALWRTVFIAWLVTGPPVVAVIRIRHAVGVLREGE